MDSLNGPISFLKLVATTTLLQIIWLLGFIFVFGILLSLLARFTRITFVKTIGLKSDIFFKGWIGVPVHELGHALFCIIFRHKIIDIRLYRPNAEDGTLGYVNHTYNSKSIYQKIGIFFIGVGPILTGSLAIYVALYLLVPNHSDIFEPLKRGGSELVHVKQSNSGAILATYWQNTISILNNLFTSSNLTCYKFWIFLYLSLCISSHMQLSAPDVKGASSGLASILIFFMVINAIILGLEALGVSNQFGNWWNYLKLESYALGINKWVGKFGTLLALATVISSINFTVSYVLLSIVSVLRGKGLVNPTH